MKKKVASLYTIFFCFILNFSVNAGEILKSTDHKNDPAIKAITKALLTAKPLGMRGEQLSFSDRPFEFIKKVENEYYVKTGDDFLFVGNTHNPETIYVSPLFHGDPGTSRLFRHFKKPGRDFFIYSYNYTSGGEMQTEYFALCLMGKETWCTNMIGFQHWAEPGTSIEEPSYGQLYAIRCCDVDGDGNDEILCTVVNGEESDRFSPDRKLVISKLQYSDEVGYSEYRRWKPTFAEIFSGRH